MYRIGNLGDMICALPAMLAVRQAYPTARLVLVTSPGRKGLPGAREMFAGVDWIDEIIEYYPEDLKQPGAARALLASLRARRFDVLIEFTNDLAKLRTLFRNILVARFTGARWAGGWSLNTIRVALQAQSDHIDFPNEVDRLLNNVRSCGIPAADLPFNLPITPDNDRAAQAGLERLGLAGAGPIIAVAPGAKRPGSRWPVERFAEAAEQLAGNGFRILVVGSPGEKEMADIVCAAAAGRAVNAAGLFPLPVLAAVIRRCAVLVCNDSGPQHIASAVGTPCVAVTSFWHLRGKWRAHHPRSVVLQKRVPCHTCFAYDCYRDNLCLTETTAAEVTRTALTILGSAEAAAIPPTTRTT